jgi:UDP-N-acetylglucosamine--N-acetylmuramyl-(pentapeptide) pyrophosphoryl-undecaprenol N-acetylglucosamine transferase
MRRDLKVVLTGGGTAGHVMPHLALLPKMRELNWNVTYIGSNGIERGICEEAAIPFICIRSGKLRRYFSLKNFFDVFNVFWGTLEAVIALARVRPQVVFSKGGYVTVPVVLAAWFLRIPVVAHESDFTPGLATKIAARFAQRVLLTFSETAKYLPGFKTDWVGTPIRSDLARGSAAKGFELCGFSKNDSKPIVLVMGGSQGAKKLNQIIEDSYASLIKKFKVIHLTGKGKGSLSLTSNENYKSFEFLSSELADVYAIVDLVVARAGANSIFEFLYLKKPMLLIPLEEGSRGDQVFNGRSFEEKGWAKLLREKDLSQSSFLASLNSLRETSQEMIQLQALKAPDMRLERVIQLLSESAF